MTKALTTRQLIARGSKHCRFNINKAARRHGYYTDGRFLVKLPQKLRLQFPKDDIEDKRVMDGKRIRYPLLPFARYTPVEVDGSIVTNNEGVERICIFGIAYVDHQLFLTIRSIQPKANVCIAEHEPYNNPILFRLGDKYVAAMMPIKIETPVLANV